MSGQIWDIDGKDAWVVNAYARDGALVGSDSYSSPQSGWLHAKPWDFTVTSDDEGISYLRMVRTGSTGASPSTLPDWLGDVDGPRARSAS